MAERLLGLETEFAFTAFRREPSGAPAAPIPALSRLMGAVARRWPHLADGSARGIFLANGARLYIDCGGHPEMTTPECPNPWDAVRYVLAGEAILVDAAAAVAAEDPQIAEIALLKCNVDYSGALTTWGCHESHLHTADPETVPRQIIPHLVSRILYTGAGGFDSRSPVPHFTLSPRVAHLTAVISGNSTHNRGIFHPKDEPLAGEGFHRLHILCGESLCSETAMWLRAGVTALIVAMIDGGICPGDAVALADPLGAMCTFAHDERCCAAVPMASGRWATALDIQHHYLRLAREHAGASFMPSWAPQVIDGWEAILTRLGRGAPDSVATVLDWAIKLRAFRDHVRRRGGAWPAHAPRSLANELFEIDARFGQLGPRSIFAAIDRAGVLDHHVAGVDNVEHAMHTPPALGRARLRGECIRRLAGDASRYVCEWHGVWDFQDRRRLDLTDPFASTERWRRWRRLSAPLPPALVEEAIFGSGGSRATPDGFHVGERVLVHGPDPAAGDDTPTASWVDSMNEYIGCEATITQILPMSRLRGGGSIVRLDIDAGHWAWRTRYLRHAPVAAAPF